MGCLGIYDEETKKELRELYKIAKIFNQSNDRTMKDVSFSIMYSKLFDNIRNIYQENLKLAPLLKFKIQELCERREKSKPVVIARGNCCQNPCYAYMKKIMKNCPECEGEVEVDCENGEIEEKQWDYSTRTFKEVKYYDNNVCNTFNFNENIDKIDYDLEEFFKYFTKVDSSEKFHYQIRYQPPLRGQPKTEYTKELERKYMIVDGKRFDAPYGISLYDYFRINDSLFFSKNNNQDLSFFYEGSLKELGKSVGYYGPAFRYIVFIYKCKSCGLKYHILKTSPFAFRDKSKDNEITEIS